MNNFEGLGVAMVTPFKGNGEIDYSALEKLTEHLIVNGCNYLVVQGTTGETPTLSEEEKGKTLDFIIEINKKQKEFICLVFCFDFGCEIKIKKRKYMFLKQ